MAEEPQLAPSKPAAKPLRKPTREYNLEEEVEQEAESNAAMPPAPAPPKDALEGGYTFVTVQGLNKVTARSSVLEIPAGGHIRFGTLDISLRSCWRSPAGSREENAALLDMYEMKPGETPKKLFLGWLFSSSPSLSALEHPFYDITVVKCGKEGK